MKNNSKFQIKIIQLTSITGGGEGGIFSACFTTKALTRMSVPGGGPSK